MPQTLEQIQQRLKTGASPAVQGQVWTATFILLGLRFRKELSERLLTGVMTMEESVTYQAIIEKGQPKEASRLLLRLGQVRFGPPPEKARKTIESMTELDHLERLSERLVQVAGWDELLA